jgi:hypothetical protein
MLELKTSPGRATSESDYSRLIELQSALNQADNALAVIDAQVNPIVSAIIDERRAAWAAAQAQRNEAETEIKSLVEAHPEWLDGKTVKTPFGTVSLRESSSLEIPNPEGTIALIRQVFPRAELDPDQYLVTTESPRKELLETLPENILSKVGVTKTRSTSITVKPAKIDMAKESKAKKSKTNPANN